MMTLLHAPFPSNTYGKTLMKVVILRREMPLVFSPLAHLVFSRAAGERKVDMLQRGKLALYLIHSHGWSSITLRCIKECAHLPLLCGLTLVKPISYGATKGDHKRVLQHESWSLIFSKCPQRWHFGLLHLSSSARRNLFGFTAVSKVGVMLTF